MFAEKCREEIVLKVTQDQRQELADFYRQIEQRAFRMAVIETRQTSEALDLVQDAMESLMKKYLSRPSAEWRPLFYRILQNKIKDWHRRGRFRSMFQSADSDDIDMNALEVKANVSQTTPEEQLTGDLSMQRLQTALNQLSVRQRQTFLLRIWEGFNEKETAQIMKCSKGSVKTHLSRAMQSLKNQLRDLQ